MLWFGASLVAGPLLVARGHGAWPITALAVYAVSVSGLFGISALYHRGTWGPRWSMRLQRTDHLMIFFLIAGTATPAFVLAARGPYGLTCLVVMWALILAAAGIHLSWMSAPEVLVGVTFVGLGSLAGLALPEVWIHAGVVPGTLMLAGGLVYIAGALVLSPAQARPLPGGVRLPRGLPRLRLRRGDLPVSLDNAHHGANRRLSGNTAAGALDLALTVGRTWPTLG